MRRWFNKKLLGMALAGVLTQLTISCDPSDWGGVIFVDDWDDDIIVIEDDCCDGGFFFDFWW